jgi:hypothetical protein
VRIPKKPDHEEENDYEKVPEDCEVQDPEEGGEKDGGRDKHDPGPRHEKGVVDIEIRELGFYVVSKQNGTMRPRGRLLVKKRVKVPERL